MQRWESEKHKNWSMPAQGFQGHVATDGSLLGTAGKWEACGWLVVQLDYDEELEPLHGMYGSVEAEFEVQRATERAEQKVNGPIKVQVDNKGIVDRLKKERHWFESWWCRRVDQNLGSVASVNVERDTGGSGACQGAPRKEG